MKLLLFAYLNRQLLSRQLINESCSSEDKVLANKCATVCENDLVNCISQG